ncbi:PHD-finger domain-containing protein [Cardiosporidium cionae]|uniref:PHD-finger domain-containing protein n=1 Tax=Cardiosporidium cionae TaxID=476202 RepID=A0ABQ7JEX6_9APIC|nr:PHD-finger domain-containing protein [Cardiosporidium cionae]|eukprot:KAF8822521.1 PHD-finger domain-containing protein [Cardiosporidium cionae]
MLGGILVDEQSLLANEDMGVASSHELSSMDIVSSSQSAFNVDTTHSSGNDKIRNTRILVNDLPVISHENTSNACLIQLKHHEGSSNRIHPHCNDPPDGLPHTPSSVSTASTLHSADVSSDTPRSEEKDTSFVKTVAMGEDFVRNFIEHPVSVNIDPSLSPVPSTVPSQPLPASSTPACEGNSVTVENSFPSTLATSPSTATDDVLCGVCFGGECEEGNQILLCDGCDKGVHQACYGVTIIPEGKWFCSLCEWKAKQARSLSEERLASHTKEKSARCKLCDHEGGIMRRGAEKVWVHSSCVLFASAGPSFRKKTELDDPCGITQSLKEARLRGYRCDLCTFGGFPLPCAYPQCCKRIHVMCAKEVGNPCFLEHIWEGEGSQRRDTVWKAVFCREHSSTSDVNIARQTEKRRLIPPPTRNALLPSSAVNRNSPSLGPKNGHVSPPDTVPPRRQPPRLTTDEALHRKSPLCTPSAPLFASTSSAISTSPHRHETKSRSGCATAGGGTGCPMSEIAATTSPPRRHLSEGNGGRVRTVGPYDSGGVVDAGTATHMQIHAAPTRGVRVNWPRYENWFKRVAIGPSADQLVAALPPANRKAATEEAKQIEEILTRSTRPPSLHQLSLPPESDLALLKQITSTYESLLMPHSSVGAEKGPTCTELHVPPVAILDFGATAVWAQLKLSSVPEEVSLQEEEAASTFLEEWNRHDAAWDVLRAVNALSPVEDRRDARLVSSASPRRLLRRKESLSSEADMNLSQSSRDGISLDGEEEDDMEEEECELQGFGDSVSPSSLAAYVQPNSCRHLSVKFGAFVKLSYFQMLYIRKKLATISVLPGISSLSPCITCAFAETAASPPQSSHQTYPSPSRYHNLPSFCHSSQMDAPSVFLSGIHWRRPQHEFMDEVAAKTLISGSDDFVGAQLAVLITFSRSCFSKLSEMRGNLLDKLLEENAAPLCIVEDGSRSQQQLARYSAMSRWSHVCSSLVKGFTDEPESSLPQLKKNGRMGGMPPVSEGEAPPSTTIKVEGEEDVHRLYCSFCFGEEGLALYQIFTCCRCQMSVHKGCYAVGKPGEEVDATEWLCKRCEYEKKFLGTQWQIMFTPGSVLCEICGIWGGAFKRTTTNTWVHLLCAVWLMPETHSEDLEQLEPWSLSNIQPWRRSSRCFFCGSEWGYCVTCAHRNGGGRCSLSFHPMCAWLHGLFVKARVTRDDFLEWQRTVDFCFPKLLIDVYCSKHTPMAVKDRNAMVQMDIRMHRCNNRDRKPEAFCHKDRRDKKKYSRGSRGSIGRDAPMHVHLPPIEDESVCIEAADQYRKNMCAVCLQNEGMEEDNPMLRCTKCGLCVHRLCYGNGNTSAASSQHIAATGVSNSAHSFQCDVCAGSQDPTLVYCRLCPRKGGALKVCASAEGGHRPTFGGGGRFGSYPRKPLFAHMTCCLWAPNVEITDNDEMSPILGVENVPKLFRLCEVCGLSYGFCLECSQRGCGTFFHPLCAQLKGYFMEMSDDCVTGFRSMAFCEKHSQIREKISPSVRLFLKLRAFLELAQIIVDQLRKRERIKHMWLRKRKEVLNREYPLLDEKEFHGLSKENISCNMDVYSCMLAKRLKHSNEKEDGDFLKLKALATSFNGNNTDIRNSSPSSSMESLASLLPVEEAVPRIQSLHEEDIAENLYLPSVFSPLASTDTTSSSSLLASTSNAIPSQSLDATLPLPAEENNLLSSSLLHSTVALTARGEMHAIPKPLPSPLSVETPTTISSILSPEIPLPDEKIRFSPSSNTFARLSLPVRKSRLFIPAWARRDDTRVLLTDPHRRPLVPPIPVDTALLAPFRNNGKESSSVLAGDAHTRSQFSFSAKVGVTETHPPPLSPAASLEEISPLAGYPSTAVEGNTHAFAVNSRNNGENFLPTHLSEEELQALVIKTCQSLPEALKRGRGRPSRKMKICWLLHSGNRAEAERYARSSGRTFEDILTSVDSTKSFPRSSPDFHSMSAMDDASLCALSRNTGIPSSKEATVLSPIARLGTFDSIQHTLLPSAALSSPFEYGEQDHSVTVGFLGEYSLPPAAPLLSSERSLLLTRESSTGDSSVVGQTKRRRSDTDASSSLPLAASYGMPPFELPRNSELSDDMSPLHATSTVETLTKRQCTLSSLTQATEYLPSSSYASCETNVSSVTPSTRQCEKSLPSPSDAVLDGSQDHAIPHSQTSRSLSTLTRPPVIRSAKLSSSKSRFSPIAVGSSLQRSEDCLPLLERISELQKIGHSLEETDTCATLVSTIPSPVSNLSLMPNETTPTTSSPLSEILASPTTTGKGASRRTSQKASSRQPKTTTSRSKPPRKRQNSHVEKSTSPCSSNCSSSPKKRRNISAAVKSGLRKCAASGSIQSRVVACDATHLNGNLVILSSDKSTVDLVAKDIVNVSSNPSIPLTTQIHSIKPLTADEGLQEGILLDKVDIAVSPTQCLADSSTDLTKAELPDGNDAHLSTHVQDENKAVTISPSTAVLVQPNDVRLEVLLRPLSKQNNSEGPLDVLNVSNISR